MKLLWLRPERFQAAKTSILQMHWPYEIHSTGSSEWIKNKHFGYLTSTHYLGQAILGHLLSCKFEILHNAKEKNLLIPELICWYKVSGFFDEPENQPRKMFVSEFDLDHAYWIVARRLGFIGEKTYRKFLAFKTKHFRLIALGMLAKREYVRRFDETGKEISSEVKVDEIGTQIFRRISYEIALEMDRLSLVNEQEFRFFWFDNIVFDTTVRRIETQYAYHQKTELMQLLYLPRRRLILKLGSREFAFPRIAAYKNLVPF